MDDALPDIHTPPVLYVGTAGMLLPHKLPNALYRQLRACCGSLGFHRCWKGSLHYKLTVNQPSIECFEILQHLREKYNGFFCELHFALDYNFDAESESVAFKRWMRQHHVKLYSRETGGIDGDSWYAERKKKGSRKHNFVSYGDKPSRFSGKSCTHLESRADSRRIIRRWELLDPADVNDDAIKGHWRKHLRLERINFEMLGRQSRGRARAKRPDVSKCGDFEYNYDIRAGQIYADIARRSQGRPFITASAVRAHLRQFSWFRPESALIQIDNSPLLKNAQVVWGINDYVANVTVSPFHSRNTPKTRTRMGVRMRHRL